VIRRGTNISLAAQAAALNDAAGIRSAALTEEAHYDKLASLCPAVIGIWDMRHPRCRLDGALAAGREIPNLVLGGDPMVIDRAAGLAFTPTGLRHTGSSAATTPRVQLPVSAEPVTGQKQYVLMLMATLISSAGGVNNRGIFQWGGLTGITITTPIAAPHIINGRINNGTINGVFEETFISPVYPVPADTTKRTAVVGTPFDLGFGWAGRGYPEPGRMRKPTWFDGKYGGANSSAGNDDLDITGISTPSRMYIGGDGTNNNTGFVFEWHRLVIARWPGDAGDPPHTELEIMQLNSRLYRGSLVAPA
jgi:hypothetical protein